MPRDMIRKPAVAGRFYDSEPQKLRDFVSRCLKDVPAPEGRVVGLLAPHAGYVYSGPTAGLAYSALRGLKFDTVAVIGTGHTEHLSKAALYPEGGFETPLGRVAVDAALCSALLSKKELFEASASAHESEHSVETQLPFLQELFGGSFKLVPVVANGGGSALLEKAGRALGEALKGSKALVVVSSDLSHYPPGHVAEISDKSLMAALSTAMSFGDPARFALAEELLTEKSRYYMDTAACGAAAIVMGSAACLELGAGKFELVSYTHSGKISHDDSNVVGYAAGIFSDAPVLDAGGLAPGLRGELLAMARKAVETRLSGGRLQLPLHERLEFNQPAAVFVTLTLDGELRGCIGSMEPVALLADAVARFAVSAAFEDPRFRPLTAAELGKVRFEVSVLSPLRRVDSAAAVEKGKHGVYIKKGSRSGTYLPQVWEHFDSKEDFLSSLCSEKAGLTPGAWKEKSTELYVYSVDNFEENP